MDKKAVKSKSSGEKKPIHQMRERHGGMSDDFKAYFKDFNKTRKAIREALKKGEATVPEIAKQCNLSGSSVLWHLMAMRKYKDVIEGNLSGDYYKYSLVGKE